MERKTAWNEYKKKDMKKLEKLNAGYRAFLDQRKNGARVRKGERAPGGRGRIRKPRHLRKRKPCVKTGRQGLRRMHEKSHCPVPDRNKDR